MSKEAKKMEWDIPIDSAFSTAVPDFILNSKAPDLNQDLSQLLKTLSETRSETYQHSARVAETCRMFGAFLNLKPNDLHTLCFFAWIHDIGKIAVDLQVLQKKSALTKSEWEEIKRHSIQGCDIAGEVLARTDIPKYILHHHERWDGTGYPYGLKHVEIPFFCRMLAVVDAFDAMTHDRAYRKAKTVCEGLAEIKKNSEIQFDPQITKAFLLFNT
jgi:HD-GYP domain